jgi:hypothetical protein
MVCRTSATLSWVYRAATAIFSFLLLVSVGLRVGHRQIHATPILPKMPGGIDFMLLTAEWCVAVMLVAFDRSRITVALTAALLLTFMSITGKEILDRKTDCGCFSGFEINPVWTFLYDSSTLLVIIFFSPRSRSSDSISLGITSK